MQIAKRLLSMNWDKGTMTEEPTSLMNFTNAKFLADNIDKPAEIMVKFSLSNIKQANLLISYYKKTIESFKFFSHQPVNDYYRAKFSKEGITKSLDLLTEYTYNNISTKAFSDMYHKNTIQYPCVAYFSSMQREICNSNAISLENYQGIILWTLAGFNNRGKNPDYAPKILRDQLNIDNTTLYQIISNSRFYEEMKKIQNEFLDAFGCFKNAQEWAPCDRKFLMEAQYYGGSITYPTENLRKKYPSLSVRSVAQFPENLPLLKNKVPELYGFYNVHYGFTGTIFGGEMDVVFSRNQGSILNHLQLLQMFDLSRNGRTSDLAHLFNLWSPPQYFYDYTDHIFFEWYFDGLIKPISLEEYLHGYNDSSINEFVTNRVIIENVPRTLGRGCQYR